MAAPLTGAVVLDTTEPSWPRVWNHLAGGLDAYQADRDFAAALTTTIPQILWVAQARLRARGRLVRYLVGRQHVEQILAVGADLPLHTPARDEIHTIAQELNPAAKTVYVAHDPMVAAHARGLWCIDGSCVCVQAAPDDPVAMLEGASGSLDLSLPVAVLMTGTLELLDDHAIGATVQALGTVVSPGSRLGVVHLTGTPGLMVTLAAICGEHQAPVPHLRSPADVAALLGLGEPAVFTGGQLHAAGPDPDGLPRGRPGGGPDGLSVSCALTAIGGAAA